MRRTRRAFLAGSAAAAGAFAVGRPAAGTSAPIVTKLSPFTYSQVQLLPGPLKRQFDQNHTFFLNLSEDRLLKIYRQRTGLPAPGEDMGGWYDDFCPGASFGQYVSALARFAAQTNSEQTRSKVRRLNAGYSQTVDPSGKFFVDLRYPAYTYDKLVCGLIDSHSYADDQNAISILRATTVAARPHMPDHALTPEERKSARYKDQTYTADECYTLAENLFLAYGRTRDRQYFDMGKRYLLDRGFFDPLSQGQNVLPGLHAYSHMNALSSGMQAYFQLGDPKYLQAVTNAVDWIWQDQSFATGGWGPNEAFVEPGKGRLGASLSETHRSFETPCGAYAHFKLMRYLFALTGNPRYADSMEQVLYNTVLGAKPIQEAGWSFYYSDYGHSGHKTDHRVVADSPGRWDHDGRWPCCSGTLPQVVADYGISTYFRSHDGVFITLYVPSQLNWALSNSVRCKVTQETSYPIDNVVRLKIDPSSQAFFTVHLRVPAWAGPQSSVSVNGSRFPAAGFRPGSFFPISRNWKAGDVIELELEQRVSTRPVDAQTPDQVAVIRGPLVLFAIADQQPTLSRAQASRPAINKAQNNDWTLQTEQAKLTLRPFYGIGDEVYQTYLKVDG